MPITSGWLGRFPPTVRWGGGKRGGKHLAEGVQLPPALSPQIPIACNKLRHRGQELSANPVLRDPGALLGPAPPRPPPPPPLPRGYIGMSCRCFSHSPAAPGLRSQVPFSIPWPWPGPDPTPLRNEDHHRCLLRGAARYRGAVWERG